MSASASSTSLTGAASATASAEAPDAAAPAEIDLSCRWPLLLFFAKGAGWLVIGSVLFFAALVKLHGPGLFVGTPWLSVGRLRPAAVDALVYGFGLQIAFALALWLLARLGRMPLLNAPFLFVAGIVWNFGVFFGVIGILGGAGTGFPWLSMPRIAWPFLFVALGLIALWGLINFHYRRQRALYPSQWFLVAALFWLPWLLSASSYLLVFQPVRGVVQSIVAAWFAHNLLYLCFTPIAIAAVYYFVPKLSGRPLASREIAAFGFWTLAFFGSWGGMTRLSGGPIPSWMVSVSVAANTLLLIPVACVAWNVCHSRDGNWRLPKGEDQTALRFILLGVGWFLVASVLQTLTSFRAVNKITLFTQIPTALDHMLLFGFFGMVAFGAAYEVLPKVLGTAWPCEKTRRWHFLGSALGLTIYFAALLIGGLIQGSRMNNPAIEFMSAIKATIPFIGIATLGWILFLTAQLAFFVGIHMMVWNVVKPMCATCCGGFWRGTATGQGGDA